MLIKKVSDLRTRRNIIETIP